MSEATGSGLDLDPGLPDLGAFLRELHDLEGLIGLVENSGFHGDLLALPSRYGSGPGEGLQGERSRVMRERR